MKKVVNNQGKIIWILSILFILIALGIMILIGASGHRISIKNSGSEDVFALLILYIITPILLILYRYRKGTILKNLIRTVLFLTLLSLLYLLYVAFKEKIGDYSALIPISILLFTTFLNIMALISLRKK